MSATLTQGFDAARPAPDDADHLLRVIAVHFVAKEAAEHHSQRIDVRIDSDGVITFSGDHEACHRAMVNTAARISGVRSDCELAAEMGLGVRFIMGPPHALDELRGLLGLPLRFVAEVRGPQLVVETGAGR